MSWLDDFMESVDLTESPKSYFYWSMLTTISAIVRKQVWVDRGGLYPLYPNIYTFLISKRSGLRKGIPINIAKKLAYDIQRVRVIDGQNSIQGVIKELSQVRTISSDCVIKDAQGFLISGEFASFLLADNTNSSLTILTDLYDAQYHEQGFKKRLVSQDEVELKNPCLTGLFASNETHFFDAVPHNAISGGFLARTFCVYEEKRNMLNSLTGRQVPVPKKINYNQILAHLRLISKLEGEMIVDPKALDAFDIWYYDFSAKDHEKEDETGTSERIGDNIWKAAMLVALATNEDLIIYEKDMEEAIEKVLECFSGVKRLLLGGNKADNRDIKALTMRLTISCLLSSPNYECERKIILRKGVGQFGVYELDDIIEHLLQAGMMTLRKAGPAVYYKLTEVVIRRHLEINRNGNETKGQKSNETEDTSND